MDELERDLIPVKFLQKNIEKQKSYTCFGVFSKKILIFDHFWRKIKINVIFRPRPKSGFFENIKNMKEIFLQS